MPDKTYQLPNVVYPIKKPLIQSYPLITPKLENDVNIKREFYTYFDTDSSRDIEYKPVPNFIERLNFIDKYDLATNPNIVPFILPFEYFLSIVNLLGIPEIYPTINESVLRPDLYDKAIKVGHINLVIKNFDGYSPLGEPIINRVFIPITEIHCPIQVGCSMDFIHTLTNKEVNNIHISVFDSLKLGGGFEKDVSISREFNDLSECHIIYQPAQANYRYWRDNNGKQILVLESIIPDSEPTKKPFKKQHHIKRHPCLEKYDEIDFYFTKIANEYNPYREKPLPFRRIDTTGDNKPVPYKRTVTKQRKYTISSVYFIDALNGVSLSIDVESTTIKTMKFQYKLQHGHKYIMFFDTNNSEKSLPFYWVCA